MKFILTNTVPVFAMTFGTWLALHRFFDAPNDFIGVGGIALAASFLHHSIISASTKEEKTGCSSTKEEKTGCCRS